MPCDSLSDDATGCCTHSPSDCWTPRVHANPPGPPTCPAAVSDTAEITDAASSGPQARSHSSPPSRTWCRWRRSCRLRRTPGGCRSPARPRPTPAPGAPALTTSFPSEVGNRVSRPVNHSENLVARHRRQVTAAVLPSDVPHPHHTSPGAHTPCFPCWQNTRLSRVASAKLKRLCKCQSIAGRALHPVHGT